MGRARRLRRPLPAAACLTAALATVAVPSSPAIAGPCAADARPRLAWIDARLDRTAHHARLWQWGWGLGIGASGVASLAAAPFVAPSDRVDWYTGAATAAIGVVPFILSPLSVTVDAPRLRAAVAALPPPPAPGDAGDDAAGCALLDQAERLLIANARNQRDQQRWFIHAGNIVFNTGVMLFLGLGYHHWTSGIINGAAGAAVGEAIIFTQPTATIDDLAAYQRGQVD